jgi:hypothetical protein
MFERHAFFEAPSIRKIDDTYYFIYSSEVMHELCYATSKEPTKNFVYGGVLVSNCDMHIDTYKPANQPMAYGANNHGSMVQIGDDWYIFYHRQTNGTWYCRQGCAEKLTVMSDGSIPQVEIDLPTSLDAPIQAGQVLGTARLTAGGTVIAEVPLAASGDVARDDFPARWLMYWRNWLGTPQA